MSKQYSKSKKGKGKKKEKKDGKKSIRSWMGEAKTIHYDIFKAMKENEVPVLVETNFLPDAKQVFLKITKL